LDHTAATATVASGRYNHLSVSDFSVLARLSDILKIDDMRPLEGWENFYVIVGSSAGALIGLQFVVITLIADMPIARKDAQASGAFSTPSVVHFGVVLLLSAILCASWNGIAAVAVLWGLVGLSGVA